MRDRGTSIPLQSDLQQLIDEQQRDDATYRVYGLSVDQFAAGADIVHEPRRLTAHDDRHGTLAMAKRHGCKCPKCRAASATYQRDYNRRRGTAKTRFVCACCGGTDVKREPITRSRD